MTLPIFWGELLDEEGRLGRSVSTDEWTVPDAIELDGQKLAWTTRVGPPRFVEPHKGLLEEFIHLSDAHPERIRDYARRWGILRICVHGLPASHNPIAPWSAEPWQLVSLDSHGSVLWRPSLGESQCRPTSSDLLTAKEWMYEPLDSWRNLAALAKKLLNIAANLYSGKAGSPADWRSLIRGWPDLGLASLGIDNAIEREKMTLAGLINEWLSWGNVRPRLHWNDLKARVAFGGEGLFGALAVQLLLVVSRIDGLAICSACSLPYMPSRRPSSARRNYCQACGRKAAARHATEDYRRRLRKDRGTEKLL